MTPQQVIDQARYLTHSSASDGTGGDTDLLRILNDYHDRQIMEIVNLNEDKFGIKASTSLNITTDQESYSLPGDSIRVKRVEVNYSGADTGWKKLRYQNSGEVVQYAMDPTDIGNYYDSSYPYYDIFGDQIYLRPIPNTNVTLGLRLWYIQHPGQISTLSGTIQTPSEFHGYLAYGLAAEIASRQQNDALTAQMSQKWELGLEKIRRQFSPRNLDEEVNMLPYPSNYA